ncbi:MAG: RdgB/HAM1 family non-canonical purine NTP pyrophosphatase [Clostridia bacterium]|nr:RdgB/HAM1 family non-canonical purine NTP pyrophosphatase [Clostridia bacterium]
MQIIFGSNNENKLREIRTKIKDIENIEIISQKEAGFDIEVDETGTTFEENAILKAEAIYNLTKKPVIAEDGGLEVDFLDGAPGVYSHRFAGENATDEDRRNKLLGLLKDVPYEKRTARFKCVGCYIDERGEKHIFEGTAEGKIGFEAIGNDGFGYDPIFVCELGKTFAEISGEEKNAISHRGKLIDAFVKYLKEQ